MQIYTNSPIIEGLTFDDVLLIPAHSDVLPREVDVTTKLTREITLHTPIVSAAMDTVTEADLAIAIAREGGIGVIHKNMPINVQMEQVRKVKRAENGMIYDPVTIRDNATVGDALKIMSENHIGGIPVVDAQGMLCGIVTNRDLRFQDNPKTPISEVMTKENLITTTDGSNLKEATDLLRRYKIEKLLVVDRNGKLAGLITYKDIMKIKDNPIASKDSKGRLLVAAAVGINSETIDKVEMLMSVEPDALVFDTAHGHSEGVLRVLRTVRQKFPDLQIIAGNIATGEAATALKECGVDAVKVGIGPGSICTTRIIAGVGVPQLSAVMMAAEALKGSGIPIIADAAILVISSRLLPQVRTPSWPARSLQEWRSRPERPSSSTAVSSSPIAVWALSKPCSSAPRTAISRIWRRTSRNSCRRVSWLRFHTRVLCPRWCIS